MFVIVLTTYDGRCYFVYYCAYHSGVASIHDGSCVLLISLNIHVAHVYDHGNHDNYRLKVT